MYYNRFYGYGPQYRGCGPWGYGSRRVHSGRNFRSVPVNIEEKEDKYELSLFAPLLEKERIRITTRGDVLTISYPPQSVNEEKDKTFTRMEYEIQTFERSFILNNKVLIDKIEASYSEGVLKVFLYKNPEMDQESKEIPVR